MGWVIFVSCVCIWCGFMCGGGGRVWYSTYHRHVGFLGRGLWSSAVLVTGGIIVDWGKGSGHLVHVLVFVVVVMW